ncbi:carboxypeptidase A1 [Aphelenchoides avenae]|nr:carboxypeptidase A1 [Aphelenchus avenae]
MKGKLDGFITLHTYAQKTVADKAVARLRDIYGTQYRIGTGADLLSPASGGSDDYAKEELGVKYVFLVELRPRLEESNGFILKQDQLLPTAIETFEAIKVVIDGVLQDNGISRKSKTNSVLSQNTGFNVKSGCAIHNHHSARLQISDLHSNYTKAKRGADHCNRYAHLHHWAAPVT